ncbi:hypothetical protein BDW59DRAFT_27496 [Aspergillus cavernicola]|uniref:Secreted protein n=1 Tax=Aspergillus cavernicola TaxID=176166 RepID=A0ABR4HEK6_9EURO
MRMTLLAYCLPLPANVQLFIPLTPTLLLHSATTHKLVAGGTPSTLTQDQLKSDESRCVSHSYRMLLQQPTLSFPSLCLASSEL